MRELEVVARLLAAQNPPTPDQIKDLKLMNGPARSSAPQLEQLKLDTSYWKENDRQRRWLTVAAAQLAMASEGKERENDRLGS